MIAIIKYNAGNVTSVQNAISNLGYESIITDNSDEIRAADKVIFPGVGEASTAMNYLKDRNLDPLIKSLQQPTLGICLGLQLMCKSSEEGNTTCLGIFDTTVKQFPALDIVPHMGWNNFSMIDSPIFKDVDLKDDVYYVHSYYAEINEQTIAACDYILPFGTAFKKDNFYAMQFHPEKSATVGYQLLKNFLSL